MTIANVGASSAAFDYEYGPVAVMLDLMNPVSTFGGLVGQAWKLRWNKAKAASTRHTSMYQGGRELRSLCAWLVTHRGTAFGNAMFCVGHW